MPLIDGMTPGQNKGCPCFPPFLLARGDGPGGAGGAGGAHQAEPGRVLFSVLTAAFLSLTTKRIKIVEPRRVPRERVPIIPGARPREQVGGDLLRPEREQMHSQRL